MSLEIIPFHAALLPEAGTLLAQRHRRDRALLPELPSRFEEPAVACRAVTATWEKDEARGVAAVRDGQLLGYLIGELAIGQVWGRSAWVRLPGCAVAPDQSAELVRDLYAELGRQWIAFGCFAHFAVVPTADRELLDAWFALSFGIEQVHALMELDPSTQQDHTTDVEIRRAGPDDRETLAAFSDVIWRYQVEAPVWGIMLPEVEPEVRTGWADLADDPTATVWLAFLEGEARGMQGYFPAEEADDNMFIPAQCTNLSIAGTREAARGRGIGRALTWYGLAHAYAEGYRYCISDWRSTNLLASRFWPRFGFRPVAYRLVRRIDPRIAWANGKG